MLAWAAELGVATKFDTHEQVREVLARIVDEIDEGNLDSKDGGVMVQACKAATTSLQAERDQKTAESQNKKIAAAAAGLDPDEEIELQELMKATSEILARKEN